MLLLGKKLRYILKVFCWNQLESKQKTVPHKLNVWRLLNFQSNQILPQHYINYKGKQNIVQLLVVVLSRMNTLNLLLLKNTLNDDLAKYQISDHLLNEEIFLDDLDKTFQVDINWEQAQIVLVLIDNIL